MIRLWSFMVRHPLSLKLPAPEVKRGWGVIDPIITGLAGLDYRENY